MVHRLGQGFKSDYDMTGDLELATRLRRLLSAEP